MSKIDIRNFSPKELEILEFFAKSLEESPQDLKKYLLNESLTQRAKVLAFLSRIPALYDDVNALLESED